MADPDSDIKVLVTEYLFKWMSRIFTGVAVLIGLAGALVFYVIKDAAVETAEQEISDMKLTIETEIDRMDKTINEYRDEYVGHIREISTTSAKFELAEEQLSKFEKTLEEGSVALENAKELTSDIDSIAIAVSDLPSFRQALMAALAEIPSGAVVSFDLRSCPDGWNEYTQAYGVFVRGIDRGQDKRDPDGERVPGSFQGDALEEHRHKYKGNRAQRGVTVDKGDDYHEIWRGGDRRQRRERRTTRFGDARETRPKNIALLYCVKIPRKLTPDTQTVDRTKQLDQ